MALEVLENNEIELYEKRALIYIPEDSIEVKMNIKIYEDGQLLSVQKTLDLGEIREAISNGEDWFIGDEDRFILTAKGREFINSLQEE